LAVCLLMVGYCNFVTADAPPDASKITKSAAAKTSIDLNVKKAVLLENGNPGFELFIKGWEPSGEFSVYAIDSDGNKLPIIPVEHAQRVDEDGIATISIPYELRGFHMGSWIIIVAGKSGIHELQLTIPKVISPQENGGKWRLDFKAAEEWEKTHKPH
jgi:hypothetical protein